MATRSVLVRPLFHNITKLSNIVSVHSLCNLFQRYGSSPSDFVKKDEFLQNPHPSEIDKSFNPSQEFLVSTVTGCPRVLDSEFLEKWQLGIQQLGIYGISSMAIRNILEIARKNGLGPNDVSRCVNSLKGLGFSEGTIARVLESVPMVIMSNEDEICRKVEFLMRIGIHRREIDRVLGLFPGILAFKLENRLKPLIDEFGDLGFSLSDVRREVIREPKVLSLENGELSQCLEMLRSLKCRVAIKESIYRDGEFRAGYKTKLRVDCLRKHGLIYRDAFTVLWKEPRVILYEIDDIEKKIEFLVREMKLDVQCLSEVPEYLGVNFDKQIVPRFNVIKYLRCNGGLGDEVGLRNLVKMSRLRFYNMYVKPYPECEKIYGRFSRVDVVQSRSGHPVGMWKLFRPQKHLNSGDDVANIKVFMKSLP